MAMAICILLIMAIAATIKAVNYFYALCGVLHYLIEKYNDELNDADIKRLAFEAKRNI